MEPFRNKSSLRTMSIEPAFISATPYQDDILALPVTNLDEASKWYCKHFGMQESARYCDPEPKVILERDGIQLGFAENGGDASQDGATIRVANIQQIRAELESKGVSVANWRVDEWDGQKHQVFFVVAPDGLCYYFHEPMDNA
jgi:catechol 2,3-dioxygenase-like lactoylglutathione lyase family enzyme